MGIKRPRLHPAHLSALCGPSTCRRTAARKLSSLSVRRPPCCPWRRGLVFVIISLSFRYTVGQGRRLPSVVEPAHELAVIGFAVTAGGNRHPEPAVMASQSPLRAGWNQPHVIPPSPRGREASEPDRCIQRAVCWLDPGRERVAAEVDVRAADHADRVSPATEEVACDRQMIVVPTLEGDPLG